MTSSMVAASIISDKIIGRKNLIRRFYPRRLMFSGTNKLLKDTGMATKSLLKEHLQIPHDRLRDIKRKSRDHKI